MGHYGLGILSPRQKWGAGGKKGISLSLLNKRSTEQAVSLIQETST